MVTIAELVNGNELQCWMRPGLALQTQLKGDTSPSKPGRSGPSDLTRFLGWVIQNRPDISVLSLQVVPFNSWKQPVRVAISLTCDISYTAFARVRRYSAISFEAAPETPGAFGGKGFKRPGSIAPFGGTANRPYRTVEEVTL